MEALANSMMVIILQYINISLNTLNFYNVMCQLYLMGKKKKRGKENFLEGLSLTEIQSNVEGAGM